jgi:hypothetical protein
MLVPMLWREGTSADLLLRREPPPREKGVSPLKHTQHTYTHPHTQTQTHTHTHTHTHTQAQTKNKEKQGKKKKKEKKKREEKDCAFFFQIDDVFCA